MYDPGDDAPRVRRANKRMNPAAFSLMIKGLRSPAGMTAPALAELCGLADCTVRDYCKSLVVAEEAHIYRWGKDTMGRDVSPYYRLGWGVNTPREQLTGAQKQRDRRARLRKEATKINLDAFEP